MSYRDKWFAANPPLPGNKYMCVKCFGLFDKKDIDIDHRIPKRDGGTDDLWNLQPMCYSCNRGKGDRQTIWETLTTCILAARAGDLSKLLRNIAWRKLGDLLGVDYSRKLRD